MISPNLEKAINDQINNEFFASYLYLSMSAYCDRQSLGGFAHWFRLQSEEEKGHAMRLFDFLSDCNGVVELKGIAAPATNFNSILALAEEAFNHEKKVSKRINDLYELALKEQAFAVQTHLHWFLTEQVEEEKSAGDIVAKLKLIGKEVAPLLELDRELGTRSSND